MRALPRLDRLDPDTVDLGPYLFTTLRNLFLKSVERGARAEPVAEVPEPGEPAPIEDDPERSTLLHRQQEEVRSANAQLAPRQRLVLALRELEDKSYAEIGVIVGLNENAVAQLISRARDSLRTELRLAQVDPERLPEECRRYLPLLSRHLDGQLRGPQLDADARSPGRLQRLPGRARLDARGAAALPRAAAVALRGGRAAQSDRPRADGRSLLGGRPSGPRPLGGRCRRGRRPLRARRRRRRGRPRAHAAVTRCVAAVKTVLACHVGRRRRPRSRAASPRRRPRRRRRQHRRRPRPPCDRRRPRRPTTTATTSTDGDDDREHARHHRPGPCPDDRSADDDGRHRPPHRPTRTAPTVDAPQPPLGADVAVERRLLVPRQRAGRHLHAAGSTAARYGACTSPRTLQGLALGAHDFAVRARDRAGNTGAPATARWTIVPPPDTTAPTTSIVSATTAGRRRELPVHGVRGRLDVRLLAGRWRVRRLREPTAYNGLAVGAHTFAVRATDAAGNTGAPATHAWTIAPPAAAASRPDHLGAHEEPVRGHEHGHGRRRPVRRQRDADRHLHDPRPRTGPEPSRAPGRSAGSARSRRSPTAAPTSPSRTSATTRVRSPAPADAAVRNRRLAGCTGIQRPEEVTDAPHDPHLHPLGAHPRRLARGRRDGGSGSLDVPRAGLRRRAADEDLPR